MSKYLELDVKDSGEYNESLISCYVYHSEDGWHLSKPDENMLSDMPHDSAMLLCVDNKVLPMFFSFKACDLENTDVDKVTYRAILGSDGQPVYTQMSATEDWEADAKVVISFLDYAIQRGWESIIREMLSMYL